MTPLDEKYEKLKAEIASYESAVVAFSGGCDSALVAKVAVDVLGPRAKAVTARSESLAEKEIAEVETFCARYGIAHEWVETREIENPNYAANPVNRCYFCKTELYEHLRPFAGNGFKVIANGANTDDLGDWRPGLKAAGEHGVKSPLVAAGLAKDEVRELSRRLGLPTWDKPAAACLSSRIPYGQAVTPEKLRQIDQGEEILRSYGFRVLRLRHFGDTARLEIGADELPRLDAGLREEIAAKIKALGFGAVEIDPEGYRQGKLNPSHLMPKA